MAQEPVSLFVYGLLKSPVIFRAVTGCSFHPPAVPPGGPDGRQPGLPVAAPGDWELGAVPGRPIPDHMEKMLQAVPATLADHELVSPDGMYFYAAANPGRQVNGYLLLDVGPEVLAELVQFEGRLRRPQRVTVSGPGGGPTAAMMFNGVPRRHHPLPARTGKPGWRRDLKAEFAFRRRIAQLLAEEATRSLGFTRDPLDLRTLKEFKGACVEDLVNAHFATPVLSDFFVGQALARPVPTLEPLRHDEDASLFADSYFSLLIRQVIFNQFEQRLFEQFRYELDRLRGGDRYYPRAISSLVALRMLNGLAELLPTLAMDALNDLDYRRDDLPDFVRYAIVAADQVFEPVAAREGLDWVAAHQVGGLLPLEAELVLSNLPHGAGSADGPVSGGFDPVYDSFRYFEDFALDLLSWKLGGHVQEGSPIALHHAQNRDGGPQPAPGRPGRVARGGGKRGFLVLALGATGRRTELALPVSSDPWVINQLIGQLVRFYGIKPHALHVSIHLPRGIPPQAGRAALPEPVIRCLLAIGGDPGPGPDKPVPRILRIYQHEIAALVPTRQLDLLRIAHRTSRAAEAAREDLDAEAAPLARHASRRPATAGPALPQPVAQYRFLRLGQPDGANYEPIILALKGLQLRFRPGDMLTNKQMQADPELETLFNSILRWGAAPRPIAPPDVAAFLDAVRTGLADERLGRSPHSLDYIDRCLGELEARLAAFNELVK